ncbi:MAG TPA: winged helix-turn-helix domain-containing protein [Candidatus Tumulicola sp.]
MSRVVGPYDLLIDERVLAFRGRPVSIAPKAVDVLIVLARDAGRIVSKAELMDRVWPDAFVDEANLTQNVYVLRRRFERDASGVRIENVPKRGYRLIVPPQLAPQVPPPSVARPAWLRAAMVCTIVLMGCAISGSSRDVAAQTLSSMALRDYMLGRDQQAGGTQAALERAARSFDGVVRAAPDNALGYAGRAETEASLAFYAPDAAARIGLQARAVADARTAVGKGNNPADAYAAFGAVAMSVEHDGAAAADAFARALAVNPNHLGALVWSGTLQMQQGRIEAARQTFARAVAIAPNASGTVASLAWSDFLAGDNFDAIALAKQMLLAHQLPLVARVTLANAELGARDYRGARATIADLAADRDGRVQAAALAARMNALTGRRAVAAKELERLGARVDPRTIGDWDAASIAAAYVALGDRRRAYLWLARVALWGRRETARDPRFASLVRDRRFDAWAAAD